jgi:hypothetical protein
MDRALFEDEPWIVLKLRVASWFLIYNFIFFRDIAQKLPLCILLALWQPH